MQGTEPDQDLSLEEKLSQDATLKGQQLARDLVVSIYAVMRTATVHTLENEATIKALQRLRQTLDELMRIEYEVELSVVEEDFFMNERRVKPSLQLHDVFAKAASMLTDWEVGTLMFVKVPSMEELSRLARILLSIPSDEEKPFKAIQSKLWAAPISAITLSELEKDVVRDLPPLDKATFVKQTYFRGISLMQQLMVQASDRKPLRLKAAKRVVQAFVEILMDTSADSQANLLVMLTEVKNWVSYRCNHGVNVCILATGLGHAIGLERRELRELGMAALLHDIGYALLPTSIEEEEGPLSPEQRAQVEQHPTNAVLILSGAQGLDPDVVRSIVGSFSHHKAVSGEGYPSFTSSKPGLFGSIIAIVDRYDAMTSARPYRPTPIRPAQVMRGLLGKLGEGLNPVMVKKFVEWMGPYPAGSIVLLDTGEIALVVSHEQRGPRVRILSSRDPNRRSAVVDVDRDNVVEAADEQAGLDVRHIEAILGT